MSNKKQNIEAEIAFFNELAKDGEFELHSEGFYSDALSLAKKYIKGEVLEAGCGSGAFGGRIKDGMPDVEITGIDLSEGLMRIAKSGGLYKKLLVGSIENKKIFAPESFDTIICPYILHHIPDMEKTFDNFYLWLKPGGHVIIIDPNGSNLVLKISYFLRLLVSKIFNVNECATMNEKNKTIGEFKKALANFRIKSMDTLNDETYNFNKKQRSNLIDHLADIRTFFIMLYMRLPFKNKGSQIVIVAVK